jgi:hypothetical protein
MARQPRFNNDAIGRVPVVPDLPRRNFEADFRDYATKQANRRPRAVTAKVGMNELANIVLGLKQDIKKIASAQSMTGAQNWVNHHGGPDKYHVFNEDANNDGIPDVVVKDSLGNPVIVDGYTTKKSDWPWRYSYETEVPREQYQDKTGRTRTRKQMKMKEFLGRKFGGETIEHGTKYDPNSYSQEAKGILELAKAAKYQLKAPRGKNAYTQFNEAFTNQMSTAVVQAIRQASSESGEAFQLLWNYNVAVGARAKICSTIYNTYVVAPILRDVYQITNLNNLNDEQLKAITQRKDVKDLIKQRVWFFIEHVAAHAYIVDSVPDLIVETETSEQIRATITRLYGGSGVMDYIGGNWIQYVSMYQPLPEDDADFL